MSKEAKAQVDESLTPLTVSQQLKKLLKKPVSHAA
jgi:hypothetical protein